MTYPVVLRFKDISPVDLGGIQMHAERRGGDRSHIDPSRTSQNELLMGDELWKERARSELDIAKRWNLHNEVVAKNAKSDKKGARARRERGLEDPWKPGRRAGPMREGVLTANAEFFEDSGYVFGGGWDSATVAKFKKAAVGWLESRFGEDAVIHARYDLDELAPHVHFVIMPWQRKTSKSRGEQRLLTPSAYPVLRNYEHAQDDVGAWFESVGLTRGARRAAEKRQAVAAGEEPARGPVWQHPAKKRERDAEAARRDLDASETAAARAAEERARAQREREAADERLAEATRRERAAAAAQAKADRDRERQRERDAELAERERAANEKDRQLEARAAELTRREKILRDAARRWSDMHDAIRKAAEKVGLLENPVVERGLSAAREVRGMLARGRGRERTRGD